MAYSVLRHKAYDDTWAWVFAFGFAMLGTLAATSYLAVVLVKTLWRFLVGKQDLDSSVFFVSSPIYFGVVSIVVIFTAMLCLYSLLERRRRSVESLLADLGASRVFADIDDLRTRRLLNIHDEVAIACGLEPPALYLMHGEESINAFTAGTTPEDTAICITYGALRTLKRAELQAVIAHEYGHIVNGDVLRNTRLQFFLGALIPFGGVKVRSAYFAFLKVMGIVALIGLPFGVFGQGRTVFDFLCESSGVVDATDISMLGGWRRYLKTIA